MASVVINTRFNNRKAEADLKELQAKAKETAREINAVEKGLGSATTKRNKLRDDLEAARQKAAETVAALDEVNARLDAGRKSKFGVTSKGDETLSDKLAAKLQQQDTAVQAAADAYHAQDAAVQALQQRHAELTAQLAQENVTADKMLEGSSGYADDAHSIVAGRMPNRGSWGATLSPGGVATVPSGYHDGSGQVTARPLRFLDLGVGQNFNVAAVFSDYRSLTVDNFVVYSVSSAHTGNSAWHHIERMNKSYNAASGKFNCSVVLGEYSDAYGGPTNYAYARALTLRPMQPSPTTQASMALLRQRKSLSKFLSAAMRKLQCLLCKTSLLALSVAVTLPQSLRSARSTARRQTATQTPKITCRSSASAVQCSPLQTLCWPSARSAS